MSRRDNWEAEDGMGFSGLVPTFQEKREEQARNRDAETIRTQSAELAALRAQVEGLRKDAERYRWLRERHRNPYVQLNVPPYGAGIISGTECDEVIDAAFARSQPVAKETKP
jgi:hypothetical protein